MESFNQRAHDLTMLYLSNYSSIDPEESTPVILSELNAEYERAYNYLCEELEK